MKETKVLVKFSAKAIGKIKAAQGKLVAEGKPHSKAAAANLIVENSK